MIFLWFVGAVFTPEEENDGILALSVADVILLHIRPWVYVTAGFYHPYLVQLVFVLPLAFGLAKRVEPDLGAVNLMRLLLFANTATAVVTFVSLFVLYIIFRNPSYLEMSFSGFTGGITALLVAYMKPYPFATAPSFPGISLRFYPLVVCLSFCFCTMVGLAFAANPSVRSMLTSAGPFSCMGGYFGWYYLRFLNKNRDRTIGDVSDEFALVVLFPDFCAPLIGPVAGFCFSVAKLCGFFKKRAMQKPKMLPILTEIKNDPIAERRKARAMKALDEKLAKLAHARADHGTSPLLSVKVRDEKD
ncbi:Predicted membrane protein [Plasmopara halstedii]|uniref:Predicted membrane protein n=1 Tax=Plasmopara halstedii TaxID=4781 RepID=A0A0P1ASK3_PLAHL|nr:Predicted membrane protein [Plasmopara halstedii]CEG44916.1 Predicted membrane protein [Plasmopara halstedii]|eukprot:XP_024581285.1 Predicted membrane protein [Plasmopara halstedii]